MLIKKTIIWDTNIKYTGGIQMKNNIIRIVSRLRMISNTMAAIEVGVVCNTPKPDYLQVVEKKPIDFESQNDLEQVYTLHTIDMKV
ncbi:MAG TPA: hypothetical protein EYP22_02275 [Methanosarcinales archaeon]|nr:hypothetical protein [Methanosarcinales archaeon]